MGERYFKRDVLSTILLKLAQANKSRPNQPVVRHELFVPNVQNHHSFWGDIVELQHVARLPHRVDPPRHDRPRPLGPPPQRLSVLLLLVLLCTTILPNMVLHIPVRVGKNHGGLNEGVLVDDSCYVAKSFSVEDFDSKRHGFGEPP